MKQILIIQRYLPHFRVDFFNKLKDYCHTKSIDIHLIYGKLKGVEAKKIKEVDLEWAHYIPSKTLHLLGIKLYWHSCFHHIKKYDMVIVQQSNREIINWILLLLRSTHYIKVAFIGHGRNMQSGRNSPGNILKKWYLNRCDWWFAYNDNVKKYLLNNGVSNKKITSFNNAVDTKVLSSIYNTIDDKLVTSTKNGLGIESNNVVLFCGGLYKQKRVEFLLKACKLIKHQILDFNIIFMGSGKEEKIICSFAEENEWIHYVGPVYDLKTKATYFKMSKLLLMPGLVGLVVLEAFAMKTPLITTNYPYHSPEIHYMKNNHNGIIAQNSLKDYTEKVIELLSNNDKLNDLIEGCDKSAQLYSLENMVRKFSDGIQKAIN